MSSSAAPNPTNVLPTRTTPPETKLGKRNLAPPPTARQQLNALSTTSTLQNGTENTSVTKLYISDVKAGFAQLVSDCHHVLEWPVALLPSGAKKGDILDFSLTKSADAAVEATNTMNVIQEVLKASSHS